jgi:hypothetical protein
MGTAFPCIAFGSGDEDGSARSESPASSVTDAFESLDLGDFQLAGSAPTKSTLSLNGTPLVSEGKDIQLAGPLREGLF